MTDLINKELIVDVDTMPLKQAMTVPALCFMANEVSRFIRIGPTFLHNSGYKIYLVWIFKYNHQAD